MSFGTGHHATTLQMMQQMSQLDFSGKSVLDFGTGTGILAIYAEMLGASDIFAIDYDQWCIENTNENLENNGSKLVRVECMDHCPVLKEPVDIILANINLNVIVSNLSSITESTRPNGLILFSGILEQDQATLENTILEAGLEIKYRGCLNRWVVLVTQKTLH
jgi:ribosomal protein L11 methyltransferase